MTDLDKYKRVYQRVQSIYPVLAGVWQKAHSRFGDDWLREFIENIEAIHGEIGGHEDARLDNALDGYAEFATDSMRNQSYFEKHRRYKNSSYAEAVRDCYQNEDYMTRCYLPGQYLSHYLWPQHFFMLRGYRTLILPRAEVGLFYEVGVGCGMYSKVTLQADLGWRGVGFDISQYSLDFTENMLNRFNVGDRYQIKNHDISKTCEQKCDFLICQEVLEHLENPGL